MLRENLHDGEADASFVGQPISDRHSLEDVWSGILSTWKEGPELVPDLTRQNSRLELHLIAREAILPLPGDVLDKNDLDLSLEQLLQEVTNDPLGLVLPDLGVALGDRS